METCTEVRSVKLHLPSLIEDFYYALEGEDYEECKKLKTYFYSCYDTFSGKLQEEFCKFLRRYLEEHKISNERDLNGLFNEILEQ